MIDAGKMTRDEFYAVWEALNQYVDNQDDSVEPSELPVEVRRRVEAANKMIDRLDAEMASMATR